MKKLLILAVSLTMLLAATALAQTESGSETVQGLVTNISGDVVLVEEDPSAEFGSDKGYFTVTGETAFLRQQDGAPVPATFDELQVGQLVAATYTGPILESYPTQGAAGSIVILEDLFADDELLCLLPEGCDLDGDGVPDLGAGEPVPGETNTGFEQYNSA